MSAFNRMTAVAAAEVVSEFKSHSDMEVLEVQWGISGRCAGSSKSARVADLARIAAEEQIEVMTIHGLVPIDRALVETAILAPPHAKTSFAWKKLIAGLRFDGFEVVEEQTVTEPDHPWGQSTSETKVQLVRMLPSDIPELDFREAESEVEQLLNRHSFATATGHLKQAMNAFQRGDWAASNSQLRTFYQDLLDKIAENLGCDTSNTDDAKRQYLADIKSGPFLIHEYNEWENDRGRPAFILGLWARLHTHGSHPGLSDEGDAAFRLQITLITARLLMRRFDERKKSA